MRIVLCIVMIVVGQLCLAQSFVAEAELSPVDENGFYNIKVTPETSALLNSAFSNIRIVDDKNKEVPYLLNAEVPHRVNESFREHVIVEKKQTRNCCTTIILHNPDQRLSNNLHLVVKNADVTKEATLLGSDDKENWFALNEHFILTPAASKEGTSEMKTVNFPLSNYQYYSLQIDDSTSAPLNILTAGYFEVEREDGKYAEVAVKEIIRSDSAKEKTTYLRIRFNGNQTIDKFELSMKGAPFFQRRAMVHVLKTRTAKGGKTEKYYYPMQEIEITSKRVTILESAGLKANEFLITIDNEDNPSLEVDSFKAYQLNRHLTAWLNAGTKYTVKVGKPDMAAGAYDISFFKDSIPDSPREIAMGKFKLHSAEAIAATDTIFTTKAYIWAAVIFVIVILGFMSVKLLNEVKQ